MIRQVAGSNGLFVDGDLGVTGVRAGVGFGHIGSHAIDLAAYERLLGKLGELDAAAVATVERSADYLAISHQLHVIRAADPSLIRFVYLLAPTDDPASPRFVVDAGKGEVHVVRTLPTAGAARRAGPCFFVSSGEPGMAGLAALRVRAKVDDDALPPLLPEQEVVIRAKDLSVDPGTPMSTKVETLLGPGSVLVEYAGGA